MYDNVKLWLEATPVDVSLWGLEDRLSNVQHHETENFKYTNGNIENMVVTIFPYGVSISGSLPKFLIGNNIEELNRKGNKYALEKLEDSLQISLDNAKVTGLEYGGNFAMSHPIEDYLQRLGEMPRRNKYIVGTTIYYNGKSKSGKSQKGFVFYDKIREASAKGITIPKGYEHLNLLRYELRLSNGYKKLFKMGNINPKTLLDDSFLDKVRELYISSYELIKKTSMDYTIAKPKDVLKAFCNEFLDRSKIPSAKEYVEQLRQKNVFDNKTEYTRAEKLLSSFLGNNIENTDDELVKEMTERIQSIDNG